MLVLLDLDLGAVLEGPPHHVRLVADALDVLGALKGGPELGEVGQLDEVPDVRERGANYGALHHLVGGGNGFGCHFRLDDRSSCRGVWAGVTVDSDGFNLG